MKKLHKLTWLSFLNVTLLTVSLSAAPQLSHADLHILPEGETTTITGTNLSGVTGASMLWLIAGSVDTTTFTQVSDTSIEVVMPDVRQETRDYHLLIETESGSTIGIPDDGYNEHTTTGAAATSSSSLPMVVRAGAVLSGDNNLRAVIVENGGVFEVADASLLRFIIAEDGAVVDFSGMTSGSSTRFYYSPDTVIIGTPPANSSELTSFKTSYGLDFFKVGYPINFTIEGPGTVAISPDKDYYEYNETVTLTATPNTDAYFIRWIGEASSNEAEVELQVRENTSQLARFSTAPNYFSVWRLEHFTVEELTDVTISSFDADPDGDFLSNAAEYAFGSDPRDAGSKSKIRVKKTRVDGEFQFTAHYTRPKDSIDVTYQILVSTDLLTWNFNGDDTDLVYSQEIGTEEIDEDTEEVTVLLFPELDQPRTIFVKISAILFE